jgi:hypothetical protein
MHINIVTYFAMICTKRLGRKDTEKCQNPFYCMTTLVHPPYCPYLAPGDFHLSGPMKVHLGGQKFQSDDELNRGVLYWLRSQYKTFHTAGLSNFLVHWRRIVLV